MPTLYFWLRLKQEVFRNKLFIAELSENSQTHTRLLRGGSETEVLLDMGVLDG